MDMIIIINMKVPRLPDAINDVAIFNHSLLSVMN